MANYNQNEITAIWIHNTSTLVLLSSLLFFRAFQKLIQTPGTIPKKPHRKLSDVKPPAIKSGLGNLRLFNRRASDTGHLTSDHGVPVLNSSPQSPAVTVQQVVVEEFDAKVFRKLMEYLHTGTVTFEPKTLIGEFHCDI